MANYEGPKQRVICPHHTVRRHEIPTGQRTFYAVWECDECHRRFAPAILDIPAGSDLRDIGSREDSREPAKQPDTSPPSGPTCIACGSPLPCDCNEAGAP